MATSLIRAIENSGLNSRIASNHIYVECPWKNKHLKKQDRTESFSINLDNYKFYCHSCGKGGRGLDKLSKIFKRKFYPSISDIKKFREKNNTKKEIKIEYPKYVSSILKEKGKKGLRYIVENRVPQYTLEEAKQIAKNFKIGFCYRSEPDKKLYLEDYLIIPVKCQDKIAYTSRATSSKKKIKHIHPKGSNLGQLLFNYNRVREYETLIICEGPFDLFRIWSRGFKNVVATFGKCVSSAQKELLLCLKPTLKNIIIMFDGEGWKKGEELKRDLSIFFNVYNSRLGLNEEPDTIDQETFESYIFEAERVLEI